MKGFAKGDPRAAEFGRKGGLMACRTVLRSEEWRRGYKSGFQTGRRLARAIAKAEGQAS